MAQQTIDERPVTARERMARARAAKKAQRRQAQREARRALRKLDARHKRAVSRYTQAKRIYGEGSAEERRAYARLLPVETEWIAAKLTADRLGVEL